MRVLPAKVAKRIGCEHIRGCSFEIGWSRIFGRIPEDFYVTFPCKTTYFAQHTERSRDLSGQTPRMDYIAIGLSKQTAANLGQNMTFKGGYFILLLEKKGWHADDEEEAPFLC